MKKNKFLKIACAMFALCLITTCVIGTTLAKYTTGGATQDSARIAKWGVTLAIEGDDMFNNEYTGTNGNVTVKSSDTLKLVAPGTSGSATFSISGTPEVAVQIDIVFNGVDIVLPAGTYADYTTENPLDTFTLDAAYYPVKFKLEQTNAAYAVGGDPVVMTVIENATLAQIKAFLSDYEGNDGYSGTQYAPNTNLGSSFTLSWEWAYGEYAGEVTDEDRADTYLANLMADEATFAETGKTGYVLETSYSISITVTQVD